MTFSKYLLKTKIRMNGFWLCELNIEWLPVSKTIVSRFRGHICEVNSLSKHISCYRGLGRSYTQSLHTITYILLQGPRGELYAVPTDNNIIIYALSLSSWDQQFLRPQKKIKKNCRFIKFKRVSQENWISGKNRNPSYRSKNTGPVREPASMVE